MDIPESAGRQAIHFVLGAIIARMLPLAWKALKFLWNFTREGKETEFTLVIKGNVMKKTFEFIAFSIVAVVIGILLMESHLLDNLL